MQKVLFVASTYSHIRNFHLPYLREFHALGWEVWVACGGAYARSAYAGGAGAVTPDESPRNNENAANDAPGSATAAPATQTERSSAAAASPAPPEHPDFIDRIVDLPFEKKMTAPANFRAASMLRKLYKTEKFDLVVTHTSLAAFFARLALPASGTSRVINMTHGYLYDDASSAAKRTLLRTAERIVARRTDLVLAMNAWDYTEAQRYNFGAEVRLVPGVGFDVSRICSGDAADIRAKLGISDDKFVLFYAAEFSARKSQQTLIQAMPLLPPRVRLVLAGDGALRDECVRLAETLGVADRVDFPGHVENVGEWLAACDAAVSASRIEGLPFNIMEAMHAGKPTIASDVKGHADLIEHGVSGLLYPYGDAAAFAAQVEALLASPERCRELGAAAHASVQRYSFDAVFPQVMGEYERVAETAER